MKGFEERNLTPRQIVEELDKYIIGQENAEGVNTDFLVEITQEQVFAVSVKAESADQAIDLANYQKAKLEQAYPPEILTERTRVIR